MPVFDRKGRSCAASARASSRTRTASTSGPTIASIWPTPPTARSQVLARRVRCSSRSASRIAGRRRATTTAIIGRSHTAVRRSATRRSCSCPEQRHLRLGRVRQCPRPPVREAGQLLDSWGGPGTGPGEFNIPHGVFVDRHGTVYVSDRENDRIQRFSLGGDFLGEWTDVRRPDDVFVTDDDVVYVAELGRRAGRVPGMDAPSATTVASRVTIRDLDGRIRLDNRHRRRPRLHPCAAGNFFAAHGITVDRHGQRLRRRGGLRRAEQGRCPRRRRLGAADVPCIPGLPPGLRPVTSQPRESFLITRGIEVLERDHHHGANRGGRSSIRSAQSRTS